MAWTGVPAGNLLVKDAGTRSMVNIAFSGTVTMASSSFARLVCRSAGGALEPYFYVPCGYHAQSTTGKSRRADSVHLDALGERPFGEPFMVFAGPPVWFHFAAVQAAWLAAY